MPLSRRQFLATAALGTASVAASSLLPAWAAPRATRPGRTSKIVIVGFGGGCRLSESFGNPAYIPAMKRSLFDKGTLYLNCRNEHATNHYGGTAAIISGTWQSLMAVDPNGPSAPTLFEVYRRATGAPANKTWAICQGGNFARLSRSQGTGYDAADSGVVVWGGLTENRPLRNFLGQRAQGKTVSLGNYTGPDGEETNYGGGMEPAPKALDPRRRIALQRTEEMVNGLDPETAKYLMQVKDRLTNVPGPGEGDLMNYSLASDLLETQQPDIMLVNFGGIDIAHQGYWSNYVKAIASADQLTVDLWEHLQSLPAYRDQTTLFVIPDHGRSADGMGVNGFQHHNGGDEACRRVGMLVLGPETPPGKTITEAPVYHVDVAATAAQLLGLSLPAIEGNPLSEVSYA